MPPEPENPRSAEARERFEKALFDLRCAEVGLQVSPPLVEDVLFHCQQAAEKAMKGYLTGHDAPFTRTHDLRRLVDASVAIDATLENSLAEAAPLNEILQSFTSDVDSLTTPVKRRPGKHKRAVDTPLLPIVEAQEFVHKIRYPKAVEEFIRVRSTPEKPVTEEEALRELLIALSQTDTEEGRQWWYRWCALYYRDYMDRAS